MNTPRFYSLHAVSVLDVSGADASKIVNNLTTNEINSLERPAGRETFFTDVKGKIVGHVCVFRFNGSLRLIGAAGQSERIASHLDRYTIVEDAQVTIRDDEFSVLVVPPEAVQLSISGFKLKDGLQLVDIPDLDATGFGVDWLGPGTVTLLSSIDHAETVSGRLAERSLSQAGETAFHVTRTIAGFPWFGVDFSESNLPQEVDRNKQAISFTKGCYLGQETVARLDAMGQVQKKLVRWKLSGAIPEPNVEVVSGEKTVGRLTSIATTAENEALAIGIARRSHFDPGSVATGTAAGGGFTATVC